ncbi:MAG: radical SAM protein, partial [Planctomycetota bacterium]
MPDVPIVWGGWHATLFPEQTAAHPLVDVVVRGQGEITFSELVDSFDRRRPIHRVEGISFRSNGSVQHNPDRPVADIGDFPPMPYDLIDIDRYLAPSGAAAHGDRRFIYFSSSVGCRHRCKFCVISLVFKRKWIALDAERVVDELESLVKKHDIRSIYFADSEFFIDLGRVHDICRGIVERGLNVSWQALLRAEKLPKCDEETLQLLRKSGCDTLVIGVETGSEHVSKIICKDNKVEHALKTARILKRLGITGHYAFVFGFPGERAQDVKKSFELIAQLKQIDPNCLIPMYFYHPDPSTALYEEAVKMGLRSPQSLEEWGKVDYNIKEAWAPWITPRFTDHVKRAVVFHIPAAHPADIARGTLTHMKSKMQKGWKKYFFRLLHLTSKFRVKHGWYGFPVEWRIFNMFHRRHYR